ncbi:hypothetical protein [Chondromyces apiculatus]|uniref:Lipoprotein n=1 Tax=Chondromyces apiculatus DSM 436 TaxID=1192034 RepID=A0A017T8N4_9BACT|nr:hypothetical protein [Chondromyces apiculatus]EYF05170.1 Hypothetical protein CAP_3535 [Chondromyces apiculatus DSM 436]
MKLFAWMAPVLLASALVGCNDGKASQEAVVTAAAQGTSAVEPQIAVPADYEDQVKGKITTDNYKSELDQLEAEIKK